MVSQTANWIDEDLEMLGEMAGKFWQSEVVPHLYAWDCNKQVDREIWRKAGAQGLVNAFVPVEYGGAGGHIGHDTVIFYEQARAGDISFGIPIHSIATHYIAAYGSEQQKRRWLPGLCNGDLVCGIAMTEPDAGTDLQSTRTRAVLDGDHYVINGSKTYITNGVSGNLFVVVCKTDPSKGAKGISLLVVEKGTDGFSQGEPLHKIGGHGSDTAELFFDDCRVPKDNLIGASEGQGFIQLMNQLAWERLIIGIGAVGYMEFAFNETVRFCNERKVFGEPLMSMQNTRFMLAEVETKLETTRSFVSDLIDKHLRGEMTNEQASMAKWWSTELLCEVADTCVQLHGGAGFMAEYPIGRLYTAVRVQKIYGGANEVMKDLISRGYSA